MKTQVLNSKVTFAVVVIFILLSLSVISFLYYQNQQLKKLLADYQTQVAPAPTPQETTDPTSNWKTYINEEFGFEIKYLENWTVYEKDNHIQFGPGLDYRLAIDVYNLNQKIKISSEQYKIYQNNKYQFYISGQSNEYFDQILSTFKFLDDQEQVACTMEAKICPDGSSVGRSGPNCEFTPCSTP